MPESPRRCRYPTLVDFLAAMGIDRAVGFTVIGKAWMSMAGLVSLVFVGHCLSSSEQGYYYTFASLLALQVFVELGLTNVLVQFASHERAYLELSARGTLEGSPVAKSRLASLLRLALRWSGVAAGLFAAVLIAAGFAFFQRFAGNEVEVGWRLPWIGTVLATAGILALLPLMAFLEGCGFVAEVARFRLFQSMAATVMLWIGLAGGAGLAAAAIYATTNLVAACLWLLTHQKTLLYDLLTVGGEEAIAWVREVWPYQWRIAVSWFCGYFTVQIFTPTVFAFRGPVEAGRMGMALTLAGAVVTVGSSWVTTKAPRFGILVTLRRFEEMDTLFRRAVAQALVVSATVAGAVLGLAGMLTIFQHPLAARMLPPLPLTLLLLAMLANLLVSAQAVYLRAFKREPFLVVSVLNAALVACLTCVCGRWIGLWEMMAAYLLITWGAGFGLGTSIYLHRRRTWQAEFCREYPSQRGAVGPNLGPSPSPRAPLPPGTGSAPPQYCPQPSGAGGT